jgi:hypothetical protein
MLLVLNLNHHVTYMDFVNKLICVTMINYSSTCHLVALDAEKAFDKL